jgi:hypothetical protein
MAYRETRDSLIMASDPKLEIILDYLRDEFPGFSIVQSSDDPNGYTFQLRNGDESHLVTMQEDFIKEHDGLEIKTCLEDYRVAAVLRNVGEFQVLVTNSGCIFA